MAAIVIPRRAVLCLGLSQLICWGISYYLIGVFGEAIAFDLRWPRPAVYGGFSLALLVMGLVSPFVGRAIDRHGGRKTMIAGSVLLAIGCGGLALAHSLPVYYGAWVCLGIAMRLTLYDAAFAALARIGGASAKVPISQITLPGGLASTVFWPLGTLLAEHFGWRGALAVYAVLAVLTAGLHGAIPDAAPGRGRNKQTVTTRQPLAGSGRDRLIAGGLFALLVTLTNVLSAGLSAHMIALLAGLGLTATAAVWVSTLRGIGQTTARLIEVLFGRRIDPLNLNLGVAVVLPLAFTAGLFGGQFLIAAVAFSFFYGAGNGIATIARGTLPLVLFEHHTYGAFVGRLLVPGFLAAAAAPVIFAFVIARSGEQGALYFSLTLSLVMVVAAFALKRLFGQPAAKYQPLASD